MKFTKMQAFGNDYVYIDAIHQELKNLPELARFVSDRHFAIGSDGMVLICPSDKGDFRMRMFNPDGTEGRDVRKCTAQCRKIRVRPQTDR